MNLQRHRTSIAISAIPCLYVVVFSFSTISVDFFIWSTICNTNAVTESVTCSANRQVKFVPLADHMVWYSIITAFLHPCGWGERSVYVCMITCICLCRCGLCLCLWPCIFLPVCPSVCAGGTTHSHRRQQRRAPRKVGQEDRGRVSAWRQAKWLAEN
jgi:hypothetical protein